MADESGEILMGCWDCSSCGARRIRGDAYQCSACGSARPKDVKFYLPEDAEVVTESKAIRAAEAGPDWPCASCGAWISATIETCPNCAARRDDSRGRQATRSYEAGQVPQSSADIQRQRDENPAPANTPLPMSQGPAPRRRLAIPLVAVSLLGIVALAAITKIAIDRRRAHQELVAKHRARVAEAERELAKAQEELDVARQAVASARQDVENAKGDVAAARQAVHQLEVTLRTVEQAVPVVVTAHLWTVRLQIEECVARDGEGWSHPDGAFDIRSEDRVHHHERVLDHVETRYRTEEYKAQDGYRTETYTERVEDGTRKVQDGYTVEDLGNGRFKRTPKYRTEKVYKTVTKTRQIPNIVTKTRQVPYKHEVYRQDPVRRPWYRFRTKMWVAAPEITRSGRGMEPLDPEGSPSSNPEFTLGARRVCGRSVSLSVEFRAKSGDETPRTVPVGAEGWRAFADGDSALLAGTELLTADEQARRIPSIRARIVDAAKKVARLEERVGELEARLPPLEAKLPPLEARIPPLREALAREWQALEAVDAKR